MRRAPSWPGPSSSPVTSSEMEPRGAPSAKRLEAAATKAATAPFMSTVPRP